MSEATGGKAHVPFYYTHFGKNILLLLLSFVTAPVSAAIVLVSLAISSFNGAPKPVLKNAEKRKTILVTGVSMTKGLTIARSLAQHTPHRIVGADISSLSPGRFSNSIEKYYRLDTPHGDDAEPYVDAILSVISSESVDLWISCSSVVAAVEDGQVVRLAKASAKAKGRTFEAIQFAEDVVEKFHEKDKFIDYMASLNLTIPESYRCTSANEALNVLLRAFDESNPLDKKFLAKPIGVDDKARNAMMTLLPFDDKEATRKYVKSLHISKSNPFQLQQFIKGKEYCTHALVIRGHIKAFTSCPSLELLMHYEPLPAYSSLSQEMLKFTEKVAQDGGEGFTGHLSFDFLVEDGDDVVLYPIECNPRAHTAVVLFDNTPEMADAYLSIFSDAITDFNKSTPVYPRAPTKSYFWVGHDLVTYGILPVLDVLSGQGNWADAVAGLKQLGQHLMYWKDGTLTMADPVPFWVLYHAYWPMKFVESLRRGKAWSRINVSTTKMFEG
jgi:predicted ATP-grasp superfamily ATP-dependent carboligase